MSAEAPTLPVVSDGVTARWSRAAYELALEELADHLRDDLGVAPPERARRAWVGWTEQDRETERAAAKELAD